MIEQKMENIILAVFIAYSVGVNFLCLRLVCSVEIPEDPPNREYIQQINFNRYAVSEIVSSTNTRAS